MLVWRYEEAIMEEHPSIPPDEDGDVEEFGARSSSPGG
jgi:hypothetical protein